MAVVLAAWWLGLPSVAVAQSQCPEAQPTYTDACGPTFVLPGWGDAGGWTDPSQYSTIQLADLNGDGRDELLGRNDQGLEIWTFDTSVGQWRPQVDADGTPIALTPFASPAPGETPATDWTKPEYYSTIRAAPTTTLYGGPAGQVVARFADGLHVYTFTPGPGGSIDGGSWSLSSTGGPFSDASGGSDPSRYSTFRIGDVNRAGPGETELIGRSSNLNGYWLYGGTPTLMPVRNGGADTTFTDGACGSPSCFNLFRVASVCQPGGQYCLAGDQAVIGRTSRGVDALSYDLDSRQGGDWSLLPGSADAFSSATAGQFGDVPGGPDCPFIPNTDLNDCLGSAPSYYETFGVADFDGDGNDEIYARAADGLRAKTLDASGSGTWTSLPTLRDLAGAASLPAYGSVGGLWGSIRTANIDGTGGDEVLALDGKGLGAWSYNPAAKAWTKLQPSPALTLPVDPWVTNPEYYSTIQAGDVDGDGRDDVIARGPFGIRTWFYNRRGTGGWERYLPEGYAAFPTTGEQNAFAELTTKAAAGGAITAGTQIRDVWTTGAAADPATLLQALSKLQTDLAGPVVGNCSTETDLAPPTYASCVPPAGSSGFTADDWTGVVNELIGEAYSAGQVLGHFASLKTIREGLFESQSGALPAIGDDLQLNGAAGTNADYDLQSMFAGATGIAASLASLVPLVGTEASAALWVASEAISSLPSASPTATSSFETTYDGLVDKLAAAQDEMSDAWLSQLQQVLGDGALLSLVGQLRQRGTWKLDIPGMLSASRQAFVLNVYQTLLPTVYQRYAVTNCQTQGGGGGSSTLTCELPTGPYVISGNNGLSGIWLAPPATDPNICAPTGAVDPYTGQPANIDCDYADNLAPIPDAISDIVWGSVSDTCNYQPGNANTLWEFGCSLGVPKATSIGADSPGWSFTTTTGNPDIFNASLTGAARAVPGVVTSGAGRSSAVTSRVSAPAAAPRTVLGPLRFAGRMRVSRGLRMRRLRVVVDRTLFEHGRREELARSASGRRLRPFALRQGRRGIFTAAGRRGPRVRLRLRGFGAPGKARLALRLSRVRTRDIRALCSVLPASVSQAGRPLELETRLRMSDDSYRGAITLRQRWRCVRDRKGEFTGIRPVPPRRPAARPGLAVTVRGPDRVQPGARALYVARVSNRRAGRASRLTSSLWDVTVKGATRRLRVRELRRGRSRQLTFTVRVPRDVRGRFCSDAVATAASARRARARTCAAVRTAAPPRVTG